MIMKPSKIARLSCHSQASTAVCVPGDPRSVVVLPRRADRALVVDRTKLADVKYTRLLDGRRCALVSTGEARERKPMKAAASISLCRSLDGVHPGRTAVVVPASRRDLSTVKDIATLPATRTSSDHVFQVVVMRVSIHCQGCAGKVKKILSKMEGVTSFSIDLESKRVTVMGHVSPVGVLESISKVKKAEFWPC